MRQDNHPINISIDHSGSDGRFPERESARFREAVHTGSWLLRRPSFARNFLNPLNS